MLNGCAARFISPGEMIREVKGHRVPPLFRKHPGIKNENTMRCFTGCAFEGTAVGTGCSKAKEKQHFAA